MTSNGAAAPNLGAKIATFIANRIWLVLIVSVIGHLGAWHWFLDLFAHFRWQYLFAALLCLCAAIYAKKRRLIGLSALALLWNFALIAHYPLSGEKPLIEGQLPNVNTPFREIYLDIAKHSFAKLPIRVLFANCAMAKRSESLLALIRAEDPDVIGIAELSDEFSLQLKSAFGASYSVQALFPDLGWQGIGVLVKNGRLNNASADLVDPIELEFPTARVRWQGGELLVVHPIPPVATDAAASRDAYFAALAKYTTRQSLAQTLIVTGDFNASVWSAPYRQMQIDGEFVDSTLGFWPVPTWHGPNALFAPLSIPIDQLLLRGSALVTERRVLSNPDSDHSVLIVTLLVPP